MAHPLHGLIAPAVLLGPLLPGLAEAQPGAPATTTAPGVWQGHWENGVWRGQWTPAAPAYGYVPAPPGAYPVQTDPSDAALAERCRRDGRAGSNIGGALIGGVVGGVIGNQVASGNRALGTVAGAAVGAVAGTAISKAENRARERAREEECADYWARSTPTMGYLPPVGAYQTAPVYQSAPGVAYAPPAYGYGYQYAPMGYVMVPAGAPQVVPQAVAQASGPCTETRTVTYEYVNVPLRRRYAPPRRPVVHDKRVRLPSGS
ncbi:glycine zipper 2TM domain-containing protein [Novosphingobium sp. Chol11]|uniref:glycine zipper 2TM domain-containing protein n=1 Tax=Novosphingobium sp. Chol11 TaxID=1385763 RepID=UPI0025F1E03C|nr:glycine zipper 2TM domain-containing protein [Novosphingobium sp. Chol11]